MGSCSSSLIPLETSFFFVFFSLLAFNWIALVARLSPCGCTNAAVDAEAWWDHVLDKDETSLSMSV